jgi:cation:H+ antiporter
MNLFFEILIIIISLIAVWLGSGLAINSVEKLSKNMRVSSFILSFFLLGFVTSLTEVSVAINAYVNNEVEISIGNLLGGIIVLMLLTIPLLGVLAKGVKLNHTLDRRTFLLCLVLLLTPLFLLIDNSMTLAEGVVLTLLYAGLAYAFYKKEKRFEEAIKIKNKNHIGLVKPLLGIFVGAIVLIIASNFLVEQIIVIAGRLEASTFIISLIGLSIGTNLPEITLAVRSIIKGKSELAFGNYIGSAVFNILIIGILAITSNGFVIHADFLKILGFAFVGLLCFYIFASTNNELSRKESFVLLGIYILFVLTEILEITF